ncbi:MAG: formate/nitrite transporter family protein [Fusobacteriaceae bacterium]
MFWETIEKVANAGAAKSNFLKKSFGKYFVLSTFAGLFVGLGILLIFSIGGLAAPVIGPLGARTLMGACFGVALSLVIMCGSELFTGNNFVMTISTLAKATTWGDTFKVWFVCFFGNLFGSVLCGYLFSLTNLTVHFVPGAQSVGNFMGTIATLKVTAPFWDLFFRGVLCNILVCLAVWASIKMTSESGKLIMIWWCLFAFITIGLEHSVANMTIFSALMFKDPSFLPGMITNLIPVTLGNIVGGAGLGAAYFYVSKKD